MKRVFEFLKKHSAIETAVEIARRLEDWPETNAGKGSALQSDGEARLSASLMDGYTMKFPGVINIEKKQRRRYCQCHAKTWHL